MGVGGNFWELLKPYAANKGPDYLREKRVAVDLSLWIVQHETTVKGYVRNPHLRLTLFRTVNLFSKYGAFPVFVVDGTPSPLKYQARIMRFARMSGIDVLSSPVAKEGVSSERNHVFKKCVKECVELLELLGMPVLNARGEAEALCAQLNREGHVDACITTDSDAFLYGANCVIKSIKPNLKEPFECYHMPTIQLGLGLHRKHLIAISLLVGNDHDLAGVQGIGLDTAVPFVQAMDEAEVFDTLRKLSVDDMHTASHAEDSVSSCSTTPTKTKVVHCSFCGHPGSKKSHVNVGCLYCIDSKRNGCLQKPAGFTCDCTACDLNNKEREKRKHENWKLRICRKIAMDKNFPNDDIIEMYMGSNHGFFAENEGPSLSWKCPSTEMLVEYLSYHLLWEPSYTRQRMLPMFSTIFLRERVTNSINTLLCEQYEFDYIQRIKMKLGQKLYVVKWTKAGNSSNLNHKSPSGEFVERQEDILAELEEDIQTIDADESTELFSDSSAPVFQVIDGSISFTTDENIELVQAAFPGKVERFNQEQELRHSKRKRKLDLAPENLELPNTKGVQLSIKEYFQTTKVAKPVNDVTPKNTTTNDTSGTSKEGNNSRRNISKSVRRRLLFD
uniref:Flap endonuclease GEN-like 1 n=1 Tax=Kalanchoe fedtschenkoi TaxID=63787 RepID=A0A7N0SZL6_KALFE